MKKTLSKKIAMGGVAFAGFVSAILGTNMMTPAVAGLPVDCVVPGMDDRCEKWAQRYTEGQGDAPLGKHQSQYAHAGALSSSGTRAFTTGYRTDGSRVCYVGSTPVLCQDMQTVAYDVVTGELLWVAHERPPWENGESIPRTIVVSADDKVVYAVATVFTGVGSAKDTKRDVQVVAYDAATGQRLWGTLYDGPAGWQDDAFAAAVSPTDDRLYLAAASTSTEDPVLPRGFAGVYQTRGVQAAGLEVDVDFALVTLDGRTGELLNEQRYGGEAFNVDGERHASWDVPIDIRVSADGRRVVLAGLSDGREAYKTQLPHATLVAWDADGNSPAGWRRAWVREVPGIAGGLGLVESQSIVAFAGAYGQGGTEYNPYAVLGLDAETGAIAWETRFALGGIPGQTDYPRGLLVDNQRGNVYLPGISRYSSSSTGTAGALALRASDGSKLWGARLRDPRSNATIIFNYDADEMIKGAIDPASGHVQLAGVREGSLSTFSLHRQTGTLRWVALFEDPVRPQPYLEQSGYDWPMEIEAAAGRAVVFGNSYVPYRDTCGEGLGIRPCSRTDFLTVAYEV